MKTLKHHIGTFKIEYVHTFKNYFMFRVLTGLAVFVWGMVIGLLIYKWSI